MDASNKAEGFAVEHRRLNDFERVKEATLVLLIKLPEFGEFVLVLSFIIFEEVDPNVFSVVFIVARLL